MRNVLTILAALVMVAGAFAMFTNEGAGAKDKDWVSIQDQVLTYSSGHYLAGEIIPTGYDDYGYNYGAHLFRGYYCNVYTGGYGYPVYEGDTTSYLSANPTAANQWWWPYRDTMLSMKWNDAWISSYDRDDDGKLDRHYGYESYIGSGAWETNHMWGSYVGDDGKEHKWVYFTKIVAVPEDAEKDGGYWYDGQTGKEIGYVIWGAFAVIQDVYNDPYSGECGIEYNPPGPTGFGHWK